MSSVSCLIVFLDAVVAFRERLLAHLLAIFILILLLMRFLNNNLP